MKINNQILENYFIYLSSFKLRSPNTIDEIRVNLRMLLIFVFEQRHPSVSASVDCSFANIDFLRSILLSDIRNFLKYCKDERHCTEATCGRKIIAFRQFWKYLKLEVHLIENNITEELESPKPQERIPEYLSLEDSVRLLTYVSDSPRNYCIMNLFLNCALKLSELIGINFEDIHNDFISLTNQENKERQIPLNASAKKSIEIWLSERDNYHPRDQALFISNRGTRITARTIQLILKKALRDAGLSEDISTNKLRHSAAMLMYQHGQVDIETLREILGHKSLANTEIYAKTASKHIQSAINANPLSIMRNENKKE